ncbi:MAG: diaminopimelate epimerase [Phycisphaerales bacterium]|nr:diaminopimelate epimerase [Phycisphaerales bacterium]MCB9856238.1 diaminopimelate epimerase [Phycisphaerales bacterium]MCB9863323.1 diaminopimelate epimerase [Phycisphaerales bacterium]
MNMKFAFTKMHGLGNDYVYVNCFDVAMSAVEAPEISRVVSDRHRGIGSDGLILIAPPERGVDADVRMIMFNADGSRGEMCGNGVRCVGKYAVDHGLCSPTGNDPAGQRLVRVQTDCGVLALIAYLGSDGKVERVRVDMGAPILASSEIPIVFDYKRCIDSALKVGGLTLNITCVSMGNPHAVAFVDDVNAFELERIGPLVERHAMFPNRVNFHVVQVTHRGEATMRTWERGSGITQACGTGACAVHVAGVLEDRFDRSTLLHLPGGELEIAWPEEDGSVFMTGAAAEVFSGTWNG